MALMPSVASGATDVAAGGDAKSSDAKSGEAKPDDAKPGEAKPSQTKSAEASAEAIDAAGCAFLIRAYDSEGKLICTSEPGKIFVITRKDGVSIDPVKILHEEASVSPPVAGKVEVMINPAPVSATAQKGASK